VNKDFDIAGFCCDGWRVKVGRPQRQSGLITLKTDAELAYKSGTIYSVRRDGQTDRETDDRL